MKLTLVLLLAFVAACMANTGGPFNTSYINGIIESSYGGNTYGHGKHLFNQCGGKYKADKWVGIPISETGNVVVRFPNRGNTVNLQFTYASYDTDPLEVLDTYGGPDEWDVFAHYTIHIQSVSFYSYDADNAVRGGRSNVQLNNFAWDWEGCAFVSDGSGGYKVNLAGYRYNLQAIVNITMNPTQTNGLTFDVTLVQAAEAYSPGNSAGHSKSRAVEEERAAEKVNVISMAQNANTAALNFVLSCSMGDSDLNAVDTNFDTEGNGNCPLIYDNLNQINLQPSRYIKDDLAGAGNPGNKLDLIFSIASPSSGTINGHTKGPLGATAYADYHDPWKFVTGAGVYRLKRNYDDEDVFATDLSWDSDDYSPKYALEIIYQAADVDTGVVPFKITWDPTVCLFGECVFREAQPDALPSAEPEPEPEAQPEAQPEPEPEPEAKPETKPEPEAQPEPEPEFEIPAAIEESSAAVVRAALALVVLAAAALF